ncbi:MAG: glycosyltransferase [Gemmatimonadales bacterium]
MKLLFVTNVYPTPWEPTRGVFNRGLVDALRTAGHEVRTVVPISWVDRLRSMLRGTRPLAADADSWFPIWYYPPKVSRTHFHSFMWWSVKGTLRRATRRWTPDAVLGYWVHPDAAVATRFARSIGVPSVAFSGGSDLLIVTRDGARRRVVSDVLASVDAIFTDGQHLRAAAVALGADPSRVHPFYRGVDPRHFHPGDRSTARHRVGLGDDERILLAVGNLVPVKGIDVLLKALVLCEATAPWHLVIIGDGPLRASLNQQVDALALRSRVRFVGRVPHDELADWFRAANRVVLASRSEGVPNVLLEAMACGVPFIATRVGGVPEISPDPAWLVPPEDPMALATALRTAYHERDPQVAATRFDWPKTASLVTGVLQDLRARGS